jgi:hypothetical protein
MSRMRYRSVYNIRKPDEQGKEAVFFGEFHDALTYGFEGGCMVVAFDKEFLIIPVANIVGEFIVERYESD